MARSRFAGGAAPHGGSGPHAGEMVILDDDDDDDEEAIEDGGTGGAAKWGGPGGALPMRREADGAGSAVVGPSGPSGLVSPSTSTESGSGFEALVDTFPMES